MNIATSMLRNLLLVATTIAAATIPHSTHAAEFLLLERAGGFPDEMSYITNDGSVSLVHRRPLPASRGTYVPALSSVAIAPDGVIYFASGLDRRIYKLREGREVLVYEHHRQVRDVAFRSDGKLFFSALDTPQDREPLDDCQIYSLNEQSERLNLVYTVRQRDVKEPYWGTFAFQDRALYISTLTSTTRGVPSSIYKIEGGYPRIKYQSYDIGIRDFTFSNSGRDVFFTNDFGRVFRLFKMKDLSVYVDVPVRRFRGLVFVR